MNYRQKVYEILILEARGRVEKLKFETLLMKYSNAEIRMMKKALEQLIKEGYIKNEGEFWQVTKKEFKG